MDMKDYVDEARRRFFLHVNTCPVCKGKASERWSGNKEGLCPEGKKLADQLDKAENEKADSDYWNSNLR